MSDHVKNYVEEAVRGFLGDPPDSDFQCGFLAALLIVAKEALGLGLDIPPFEQAQELARNYELNCPWDAEDHETASA